MFEKLILKDEKYKQIYEDILLNSNNINHARRYTIKQFLMDNYNSYIEETKKEEQLIKRESNIYQTVLEDTLDKKLAKKVQVKYVSKKLLKDSLILAGTLSAMIVLSIPFYYNVAINLKKDELVENAIIYENELNEYNQNLDNYINSIDWESLTDLEIFMLVMNDMWESIEGYGKDLITWLKKLAKSNYAELNPSKLIVLLSYSHPPMVERITNIEKNMEKYNK